jgi:hypothetical protein
MPPPEKTACYQSAHDEDEQNNDRHEYPHDPSP